MLFKKNFRLSWPNCINKIFLGFESVRDIKIDIFIQSLNLNKDLNFSILNGSYKNDTFCFGDEGSKHAASICQTKRLLDACAFNTIF